MLPGAGGDFTILFMSAIMRKSSLLLSTEKWLFVASLHNTLNVRVVCKKTPRLLPAKIININNN